MSPANLRVIRYQQRQSVGMVRAKRLSQALLEAAVGVSVAHVAQLYMLHCSILPLNCCPHRSTRRCKASSSIALKALTAHHSKYCLLRPSARLEAQHLEVPTASTTSADAFCCCGAGGQGC